MLYNTERLYTMLVQRLSDTPSVHKGETGLTAPIKHITHVIAESITDKHNLWQESTKVSGVSVTGGSCIPQGPLINGVGVGAPGALSGTVQGCYQKMLSLVTFEQVTNAQKSFLKAVATGFESVFNQFIATATLLNILVNKGKCSCRIDGGVPTPGSYSEGEGTLATLQGNIQGTLKGYSDAMINALTDACLKGDVITVPTKENLQAIAIVLEEYHTIWLQTTKVEKLNVTGGITFPNAPIAGSIGNGGILV